MLAIGPGLEQTWKGIKKDDLAETSISFLIKVIKQPEVVEVSDIESVRCQVPDVSLHSKNIHDRKIGDSPDSLSKQQ